MLLYCPCSLPLSFASGSTVHHPTFSCDPSDLHALKYFFKTFLRLFDPMRTGVNTVYVFFCFCLFFPLAHADHVIPLEELPHVVRPPVVHESFLG